MPKDIEVCTKYFMLFSLISGQCLWVWLSNSSDFVWRRAPLQLSFASSHGAYAVVKLSLIKSAAKNSEDVLDRERYAWENEKRVRPLGPTSYRILLIPVRDSSLFLCLSDGEHDNSNSCGRMQIRNFVNRKSPSAAVYTVTPNWRKIIF